MDVEDHAHRPCPVRSGRRHPFGYPPQGPSPGARDIPEHRSDMFSPLNRTLHRLPRDYLPWDRARVMGPLLEAPWTPCLPGANPQTEPTGPARRNNPGQGRWLQKKEKLVWGLA